ncbi:MAG: ATP-binding protein, partial [Elsteraceae bacterium]
QDARMNRARMIDLQSRADHALAARDLGADYFLRDEWFAGASAAIESFHALRDAVARQAPPLDPKLVDAEAVRYGVFQITEHAGRERGLLAAAISAGRPLTPTEMTALAEASGHLSAGWSMLRARRHLHDTATRQAVDAAQQIFLNNYEDLRTSVRLAALDGRYPVSAAEWIGRSTMAIESVRAVQTALHREIVDLLAAKERGARAWATGGAALLVLSVVLLLISLRVILVGVSRDLEDQRQGIQEMEKQERLSSLGGLVAGVAHEINTPIGVAVTAASYLADMTRQLDRDYRQNAITRSALEEYVESAAEGSSMILRNLERAASLISSFKRISVDQASDDQRTFNLTQLINDVLATLRPQMRLTPHQIVANCPPELMMSGSPGLISQIITNLIMNSVTHAFPGKRVGRIEITALQKGGVIRLIYRDDGVGAPASVLNRMFEPFFTTKRGSGGSGLGLSIVHTLVTQKLRGAISVFPAEPGLQFDIALPVEPSAGLADPAPPANWFARWGLALRRWRISTSPKSFPQETEAKKC